MPLRGGAAGGARITLQLMIIKPTICAAPRRCFPPTLTPYGMNVLSAFVFKCYNIQPAPPNPPPPPTPSVNPLQKPLQLKCSVNTSFRLLVHVFHVDSKAPVIRFCSGEPSAQQSSVGETEAAAREETKDVFPPKLVGRPAHDRLLVTFPLTKTDPTLPPLRASSSWVHDVISTA